MQEVKFNQSRTSRKVEMFYISRRGQSHNGANNTQTVPAVVVSNNKNNENSNVVGNLYTMTTQSKTDLPTHVTVRSTGVLVLYCVSKVYSVSGSVYARKLGKSIPVWVVKAFMDGKRPFEGLKDRITGEAQSL